MRRRHRGFVSGLFVLVLVGMLGAERVSAELRTFNPEPLVVSRDYSQVSISKGRKRTVYIAAQGPVRPGKQLSADLPIREQTRRMLENVSRALSAAGATPADVARIRTYVTEFRFMTAITVGQEMRAYFGNRMPVSTFIPVDRLIWPHAHVQTELLVVLDR